MSTESLSEQHLGFARHMVLKAMKNFSIPSSYYDEILSAAHLGLVEAAQSYKSGLNVKFTTYAFLRVRGSIIDQLRTCTGITSRSAWEKFKRYQTLHELFKEEEPQACVNLEDVLNKIAIGAVALTLLDDPDQISQLATDKNSDPASQVEHNEQRDLVFGFIEELNYNEKMVIKLFYFEGLTLEEIGEKLTSRIGGTMSKSWVSRIHKQAINKIRDKLIKSSELPTTKFQAENKNLIIESVQ
jgi:RNA polymerase sigma factor FliA